MGVDTRPPTSPWVGVGDMSGDVFGNGMLLSQAHQAAGGLRPPPHLHRPDARCRGFLCRARAPVQAAAFVLGRLREQADLQGRRHLGPLEKSVPLSPQARAVLGIEGRDT
jgi:glutamate dehydrogenase